MVETPMSVVTYLKGKCLLKKNKERKLVALYEIMLFM